jgi:hypothetical protein
MDQVAKIETAIGEFHNVINATWESIVTPCKRYYFIFISYSFSALGAL